MKKTLFGVLIILIVAVAMGLQKGKANLITSFKPFTAVFQTAIPSNGVVGYETVAYKEDGSYAMTNSQTRGDKSAVVTIFDLQNKILIIADPMIRIFWKDPALPPGLIEEKSKAPTSCLTSIGRAKISTPNGQCEDVPPILGLKVQRVVFSHKIRRNGDSPEKDSGSVRRVEYRAVDYNFYPIKVETYMTPPGGGQEQQTAITEVVEFKPGKPDESLFLYNGFKEEKEAGALRNATSVARGLPPMTAEEQSRETLMRLEQRKAAHDRYNKK